MPTWFSLRAAAAMLVAVQLPCPGAALAQDAAEATVSSTAGEESPLRIWSDATGRTLNGELLAYDRVRATLKLDTGRVVFVAPATLNQADRDYLSEWRKEQPKAPWIDPQHMPPWPSSAGAGPTKVVAAQADALATLFTYQSKNFEIVADVRLPLDSVAEMATAFEATRSALLTLPLGLGGPPQIKYRRSGFRIYPTPATAAAAPAPAGQVTPAPKRLKVELFITPQAYGLAGGPSGTGGYYSSWRRSMLISLQNFGIGADNGQVTLNYRDNLFIIRHEVCHQVMSSWLPLTPVFFYEGIAEYMAAVPYSDGRYRFRGLERDFIQYLNKWRYEEDPRTIPMRPVAEMFHLTGQQWQAALSMETPVLNYNSAALLTWYFLHQDGEGDGAHLAAYLDAVRRQPQTAAQAITTHLLRDRSPEQIAAEIQAGWKKHGIDIVIE